MNILVTGSAGFIGNNLLSYLDRQGHKTWSYDKTYGNDILNSSHLQEFVDMSDIVYHLAASKDVRDLNHFAPSITGTYSVLECMRKSPNCKTIIFTSTSAVYGYQERTIFSEEYDPPRPISIYAAAKAAAENLICGYCHTYGLKAIVFRIANIVGPAANSGVVPDLVKKLKEDPTRLEILGDGQQRKSYLHVDDVVKALTFVKAEKPFEVINLSNKDTISVDEIADLIISFMKLKEVKKEYKESWLGDVHSYDLHGYKLKNKGWLPKYPTSKEAIMQALIE